MATASLAILSGYGSLTSIKNPTTYVDFAEINVNNSLYVKGQLVNLQDSLIASSVNGAIVEYNMENIVGYKTYKAPDPVLVQNDNARNYKAIASNTGYFKGLSIIGIIAYAILSLSL